MINVRDWHERNESYDEERRMHGRHCEAGTWGAGYVDGLRKYLSPAGDGFDGRATYYAGESVRIYHVHADSIFDFRPRWTEHSRRTPKFKQSRLEQLLDILIAGTDEQVDALADALGEPYGTERQHSHAIATIAGDATKTAHELSTVYVAVIGIYTDVKIPILLAGLRARYLIPNLAVSDTLTASRGLERQLVGLDFADKLLGVEVIHGIEDLAAYVGSELELEDESKLVAAPDFQQFRSYFADKQNVLAHQTERLDEYQQLTERRSIRLYRMIAYANAFLLIIGGAFLLLALVSSILNLICTRPVRLADRRGDGRARPRRPGRRLLHAADQGPAAEPQQPRQLQDDPRRPQPEGGVHALSPDDAGGPAGGGRDRAPVGSPPDRRAARAARGDRRVAEVRLRRARQGRRCAARAAERPGGGEPGQSGVSPPRSTSLVSTVPAVRPGAVVSFQYRFVCAITWSGGGAPHADWSSVVWASLTRIAS